mmetsp:Transcript_19734/g.29516  ORF Transcript_19734/g.29516 Transcript_19734/m.29516 type:complete len:625 (+) Transcript_19734:174-2048(+)
MTKEIREAFTCKKHYNDADADIDMEIDAEIDIMNRNAVVTSVSISLTPEEEQLFQTLESAAVAYENHTLPPLPEEDNDLADGDGGKSASASTSSASICTPDRISIPDPDPSKKIAIRVAGGWVRDKILNHSSHDVDIALDSLSGLQFASIVQRYLLQQQMKPSEDAGAGAGAGATGGESNKPQKKPKIAVIAANPNQSKHLETATMKIHSIDVDFVHLRGGEIYAPNSRIPTTKENATPLDDALRRDFTVNSLFYNLRTGHIEDYTGRGIPDLTQNKALVTPIDAALTFHDDPLRVLRAIRFGVRYDLALSQEIVDAARSVEVHDSLHVKVSRERVGKELEGMLSGKNARPDVALRLITDLKLGGCVFCFPSAGEKVVGSISIEGQESVEYSDLVDSFDNDGTVNDNDTENGGQTAAAHAREMGWEEAASTLNCASPLLRNLGDHELATKLDSRLLYLSTFLYPFRKLSYIDKKKKVFPMIMYMIKESIKFPNKDVSSIRTIIDNVDEMRSILNGYRSSLSSSSMSTAVGGNESENEKILQQPAIGTISESTSFCRLQIGLILRRLKDLWSTALVVAAIAEIRCITLHSMEDNQSDSKDGNSDDTATRDIVDVILRFYEDIQKK